MSYLIIKRYTPDFQHVHVYAIRIAFANFSLKLTKLLFLNLDALFRKYN